DDLSAIRSSRTSPSTITLIVQTRDVRSSTSPPKSWAVRMHSQTIWFTGGGKCSDAISQGTIIELLHGPSRNSPRSHTLRCKRHTPAAADSWHKPCSGINRRRNCAQSRKVNIHGGRHEARHHSHPRAVGLQRIVGRRHRV